MTSSWWLYAIPFFSAFVNWFLLRMAIRLLFHPRQPKKVLGFTLQGIFPKRQRQLAEQLGRVVGEKLFSSAAIEEMITHPDNVQRILPVAEQHIDHFLRVKLQESMPMVAMFIGEKTIEQLKTVFMKELEELFPIIMKSYVSHMESGLDLKRVIVGKIANFPGDRLERMLRGVLRKELRIVELVGAALGFLIGLLQIFLTFLMQ